MTTRVSVATQFSGMANPAPVELLAAGYTNPAREWIASPTGVTRVRRRKLGDEATGRLGSPDSSPDDQSTTAEKCQAFTPPCIPLLDWGCR